MAPALSSGLFARLFRSTKPSPQLPKPVVLLDSREEDDEGDVDKAWHAIHYLLTGTAKETGDLLGFLHSGGIVIEGTDTGLGAPRAYTSDQVAAMHLELNAVGREVLSQRYNPKAMDKLKVYPQIWSRDGDEGLDYIWQHFERLRAFIAKAQSRRQGLLIWFT